MSRRQLQFSGLDKNFLSEHVRRENVRLKNENSHFAIAKMNPENFIKDFLIGSDELKNGNSMPSAKYFDTTEASVSKGIAQWYFL